MSAIAEAWKDSIVVLSSTATSRMAFSAFTSSSVSVIMNVSVRGKEKNVPPVRLKCAAPLPTTDTRLVFSDPGFTVSLKLRVRMPVFMSSSKLSSTGGVLSGVKLAASRALSTVMAIEGRKFQSLTTSAAELR